MRPILKTEKSSPSPSPKHQHQFVGNKQTNVEIKVYAKQNQKPKTPTIDTKKEKFHKVSPTKIAKPE